MPPVSISCANTHSARYGAQDEEKALRGCGGGVPTLEYEGDNGLAAFQRFALCYVNL